MNNRAEESQPAARIAASPNAGMTADAGFSMMAKVLYLVTRLGIPPMVLAHVSLGEYGLWSACFILVGYIGMADLGFSSVYVRLAARAHVQNDTGGIGRLLSTGIICMTGICLILLGAVLIALPSLMNVLNIEPAHRPGASILIVGVALVFLFDMCLNAFAYVLHGLQRFRAEQKVWMMAFLVEMAVIFALLMAGVGILSLLVAFAVRYVFSISCNVVQVYRELPGLAVTPAHFDRHLLPEFLRFGLAIQASTFFSMALHSADRLVAGYFLGPQAIALFDLGGKLPVSATSIPAAITQITMPAAARLSARLENERDNGAIAKLYAQTTRSVCLVASLPMAFFAVFAVPLCFAWLGQRAELSVLPMMMTLAALGALLHITTGPGTSVFRGIGNTGNEFIYHALRVIFLAITLTLAWQWQGLNVTTIAIALSVAAVTSAMFYLAHNHRSLGLPLTHLFLRVLLPSACAFAVALFLLFVWKLILPASLGRGESLTALLVFGVAHCILSIMVIWLFLDHDEKHHLTSYAQRYGVQIKRWGAI